MHWLKSRAALLSLGKRSLLRRKRVQVRLYASRYSGYQITSTVTDNLMRSPARCSSIDNGLPICRD